MVNFVCEKRPTQRAIVRRSIHVRQSGRADEIRAFLQSELKARIPDLHLWRLGPGHQGLIVSLITPDAVSAERVKESLRGRYPDLSHVTVEVAVCADCT